MRYLTFFAVGSRTAGRIALPFLKDRLLHLLLGMAVLLGLLHPVAISECWRWVDWPTIFTLTGLMLVTKGIELSGYLDHLGRRIIRHVNTRRSLALFLVSAAALLSMVLTNDIALFIVVPLTLGMRRVSGLPAARLVIFQALAVNAGSLLTPIGNPQNILLWQKSGLSFAAFTLQMVPLAAVLLILLLIVTAVTFSGAPVTAAPESGSGTSHIRMLTVCSIMYVAFLIAVELSHPGWALPVVLGCMFLLYREVLLELDWSLLAVFVLMFIDVRMVTESDAVNGWLHGIRAFSEWRLFLGGLVAAQLISNVPATILLLKYVAASKTVAYAVNVGGFGAVVGSMANLIALRMLGERGIWLRFHFYSIPFLVLGAGIGYALLSV